MAARYHIKKEIGRGAMGRVYLAHDDLLDRDVALKELAVPDYLTDEEKDEVKERFRLEAKAAARLTHPHILTVHDIVTSGDRLFIVMEYLEGKTLRDVLAERTFSVEEVMSIAPMIGEALYYAHSQGIIHRDIKPDNIFILEDGNIRVADFGIAKMLKVSDRTHTDVIMGTPNYIAPELVKGEPYDHRVDIFSLGVTLYEILAGRRPFDADNDYAIIYKVASEEPEPLDEFRDDAPPNLLHAVHHALEKDPDERYPSMKEFKEDLMLVRAGLGMATVEKKREQFDKERALQSELEVARHLDDSVVGADTEASEEYDFSRDKEWKELIARIYHGDADMHETNEVITADAVDRRTRWQELEDNVARGASAYPSHAATRPARAGIAGAHSRINRTLPYAAAPTAQEPPGIEITSQLVRWGMVSVGSGVVLISSVMFPWIGRDLSAGRTLLGITFPEGIVIVAFAALIWGCEAFLLLGVGRASAWAKAIRTLSLVTVLSIFLFFGLRVIGGIGFEKAAGVGISDAIKDVGWGFWLALVASFVNYWACNKFIAASP